MLSSPTVHFSYYSTDVGVAVAFFQFATVKTPARVKVRRTRLRNRCACEDEEVLDPFNRAVEADAT